MSANNTRQQYEDLYTELLGRGDQLHESNKKRIRRGIILLVILPVILEFIRWITDSDKVVFLIIWIFIMFVLSAYLISIEYLDSTIEKTLRDVTDTEAEFDDLLEMPDLPRSDLHERIRTRIEKRRAERESARELHEAEEAMEELKETVPEEAIATMKEVFDEEAQNNAAEGKSIEDLLRTIGEAGKEDVL